MIGALKTGLRVSALLLALVFPLLAVAQDSTTPDYDAWVAVAERGEAAVDSARASNAALEELRSQIVLWRQIFLTAQGISADRIATLQEQFKALGPAPGEGQPAEGAEIAQRRDELNTQIARLQAPIKRAEEAYKRADGVIKEIDRIIRERQTSLLFELGPTPLNPVYWARGYDEGSKSINGLIAGIRSSLDNPIQQKTLRERLLPIVALIGVGLVLLSRGGSWTFRFSESLRNRFQVRGFLWQFLLSIGQLVLPLAGVYALVQAANFSDIGGPRTDVLLAGMPYWAGILIVGQWLAGRIFGKVEDDAIYKLGAERNLFARRLILGLTSLLMIDGMVSAIAVRDFYSPEASAVIGFPLVVIGALLLFRFARLLTGVWSSHGTESTAISNRLLVYLGRAMMFAAVLSPVLAAIGYEAASNSLIYPAIATLGPIGLVIVLHNLFTEAYILVTGDKEQRESLVTVLFGYFLVLTTLPVLALIWGARLADLSEAWTRFQGGFALGDNRISPTDLLGFILFFAIGYSITRVLQGTLKNSVLPKTKIDTGGQNAIVSGTGYIGIFLSALIAISSAGIDLSSLAIVAGALSVGIGFGLQNIVSNFVSGIILLIERPIAIGDWIEVGGQMGNVRDISVRSTRIETFDRTDLIIPNADLVSGQVTNWTRGNLRGRVIVPVGVAYGSDTKHVESILLDIAKSHPNVMLTPLPSVIFQGFGASSLDFEIRAILKDVNWILQTKSDINHAVAKRFVEAGIEIPFNQSEITIRNLEDWLAREKPS